MRSSIMKERKGGAIKEAFLWCSREKLVKENDNREELILELDYASWRVSQVGV